MEVKWQRGRMVRNIMRRTETSRRVEGSVCTVGQRVSDERRVRVVAGGTNLVRRKRACAGQVSGGLSLVQCKVTCDIHLRDGQVAKSLACQVGMTVNRRQRKAELEELGIVKQELRGSNKSRRRRVCLWTKAPMHIKSQGFSR